MCFPASRLLPLGLLLVLPLPVRAADPPPAKPAPRLDAYGDALPEGAVARLGTVRFAHERGVGCAAWSADGKVLVTSASASDNVISFWDIATGKEVRHIDPGHSSPRVALSPDGKRIASAASTVRVLDATSGKRLFECAKELDPVRVGFSPDGKTLATAGRREVAGKSIEEVVLCDAATGKETHRLTAQGSAFAFSPDSKALALGTAGGGVALVDLGTGKSTRDWQAHTQRVGALAFSPDGKTLASGGGFDKMIALWDVPTGKELRRCSGHLHEIAALAFTPDGEALVSGGWGDGARVWDVKTGKELRSFGEAQWSGLTVYALSPDGKTLAAGNYLQLWDVRTGKEVDPRPVVFGPLAFSPDGKTIVSAVPTVQVWDAATGKRRHDLGGRAGGSSPPAFSPDGKRFAVAMGDRTVRAWDQATGKELYRIPRDQSGGTVAFSGDGKTLLCADGHAASAHDAATGAGLRHVPLVRDGFERLADPPVFAPDGRLIAGVLGGEDRFARAAKGVRLWDAVTGKAVRTLAGERADSHRYGPVAFSPDGKLLAVAENGYLICLWDVGAAKELGRWPAYQSHIHDLTFSPDGSMLASAGDDKGVRLWEVATGAAMHDLAGHRGWLFHLASSPDGRFLATSGSEGFSLVWDLSGQAAGLTKPGAKELPGLWDDLKGDDAGKAYRAACRVAASPEGVAFLAKQLGAAGRAADEKRIRTLIADLDADDFDVRESASMELAKLGAAAESALRGALKGRPSPEVKRRAEALLAGLEPHAWAPERRLARRAVAALERAGSAEARQALRELAKGSGDVAEFAGAAVRRLAVYGEND